MNSYLLIDSRLVPSIWHYLAFKPLSFEPLYRSDISEIKGIIPYIIQLDKKTNTKVVNELVNKEIFHSGLIIQSQNTLTELTDKLSYFYHVVNAEDEPCLQHYFELRVFPDFIDELSEEYCDFLFGDETVFYYLDDKKENYHKIAFQDDKINYSKVNIDYFRVEVL